MWTSPNCFTRFILNQFGHVTITHVKMAKEAIFFCCLLLLFAKPSASDAFANIFDDVSSCKDVCRNTYTPHTYEKVNDWVFQCTLWKLISTNFFSREDQVIQIFSFNYFWKTSLLNCISIYFIVYIFIS